VSAKGDHAEALHTLPEEAAFEVRVGGGTLVGHRGGEGPPALVLHGGPAIPDYTKGLAGELSGLLTTLRYTQRGTAPSTTGPPYTIESHMSDALAVLDHFGVDRAWAVGHSWGAHLALHLAVARPERLLGVVAVGALGAFGREAFAAQNETLRRDLTPEQWARVGEVEELRHRGEATEADLLERWGLIWPSYFADPDRAMPLPDRIGAECSRETNASIAEHFERDTLRRALPSVEVPMLFVHGELDLVPLWSAEQTAALVPGARCEAIPGCGHFPWWDRPGEVRRIVGEFLAEQT